MSAFTKSEAQPSSPTVPGSAHAVCFFVLCKRHWINSGPKLSRFKFQVQALLSYSLANLTLLNLKFKVLVQVQSYCHRVFLCFM